MTPAAQLARRRALMALTGMALPPEVEVAQAPDEMPELRDMAPMEAPPVEEVSSGVPQPSAARDYYAEATKERDRRRLSADIGRAGGGIIEALTGVAPDKEYQRTLESRAGEPVLEYMRRQQLATQEAKAVRAPGAGKPAQTDEQARAAFRARYPDASEEEVATVNAANFEAARKTAEGKAGRGVTMRGQNLTSDAAKSRLEQIAKQHVEEMDLKWENLSHEDQRAVMRIEEMRLQFQMGREDRETKTRRDLAEKNVGGFTFDPENPPSADASKQMAQVAIQSKTINQGLGALEALYRKSGTEIVGSDAGAMGAEWKNLTDLLRNISNMGVPNGRDYEMLALQLENPTELKSLLTSKARGLAQMKTVRAQIQRLVAATAEAYKFRPDAQKPRSAPSRVLPKDATGQPTLDPPATPVARRQYSASRNRTRELDANGKVIREYEGPPHE